MSDTRVLLAEYAQSRDPRLMNDIIEAYMPLVRKIARTVKAKAPAHARVDDLISYGMEGLYRALNHYDPERHQTFDAYAATRIQGWIVHEVRSSDFLSRSVWKRNRMVQDVAEKLQSRGEAATPDAIAANSELSEAEVVDTLRLVDLHEFEYLDEHDEDVGEAVSMEDDDSPTMDRVAHIAERFMRSRTPRERLLLLLLYGHGRPLAEVAGVLGVPTAVAARWHSDAAEAFRDVVGAFLAG